MNSLLDRLAKSTSTLSSRLGAIGRSPDTRKIGFMILGIQKGGSTWLAQTLDHVPGLKLSTPKETRFFNAGWNPRHERVADDQVRSAYLRRHWPRVSSDQVLFEASPGYLASDNASRRVAKYCPDVKCIVLLRDPTARAFSAYNMWVRRRGIDQTFRELYAPPLDSLKRLAGQRFERELDFFEAVRNIKDKRLISHGLYYYHLKIWFSRFPRDRFFIMTTKELSDTTVYGDLLEFLGCCRDLIRHVPFDHRTENEHHGDPIDPEDASVLNSFYAPYNDKLYDLLGVSGLNW